VAIAIAEGGLDAAIVVRDEQRMLMFYRDFLGFELEHTLDLSAESGLKLHFLRVGSSHLKLVVPSRMPAAENPGGAISDATGLRYVTIRVVSLVPVLDGLDAAGGTLTERVIDLGSARVALLHDPEGNMLELLGP
jgi:catechol 2,3-dioxygenase-like lactoylglutathione lyase family enzyme